MTLLLRATRGAVRVVIVRHAPAPDPAGAPERRRPRGAARAALLWAAVAFALGSAALVAAADALAPEVYDPQYGARLARLRGARAEHPDRPLLVALGSSRTCQLFRPEHLPPLDAADGRAVLPFNFARTAGGPVYCRLAYGRLRRDGPAPAFAVVELMPLYLVERSEQTFHPAATAGELPDLAAYTSPDRAAKFYLRSRSLPWRANRAGLVRRFAPAWSVPFAAEDPDGLDRLGGEGRLFAALPAGDRARVAAPALARAARLTAGFRVAPGADRAVRDLLGDCRAAGTRVALVLTPESSAYRAAYQPGAAATVAAYAAGLGRDFGAAVIDARDWLPDDHFFDGEHPLLPGQALFTVRLHREALVPLVAGR